MTGWASEGHAVENCRHGPARRPAVVGGVWAFGCRDGVSSVVFAVGEQVLSEHPGTETAAVLRVHAGPVVVGEDTLQQHGLIRGCRGGTS